MDTTAQHEDTSVLQDGRRGFCWREALRSLSLRATLLVVLLIVAVTGTATFISTRAMNHAHLQGEYERTEEWATTLAGMAAPAISGGDSDLLGRMAQRLVDGRAVYAFFTDADGSVLHSATSSPALTGPLLDASGRMLSLRALHEPLTIMDETGNRAIMDIVVPVYGDHPVREGERTSPTIVGYLRLGADITESRARLEQLITMMLQMAGALVLLIVPCGLFIMRNMVSPLNELTHTARAFAGGSMDARARVNVQGELADLARSFNLMADRVTRFQLDLVHLNVELENRVVQRTRELEDLAARDPLTGLYNRRHFGEVIMREFAAAERYNTELSCLMFDIDHFKETNDRFGHRTGDEILMLLAEAIRTELRGADVAARFGGDEFIILMPQTAADAATSLGDRITRNFDQRVRTRFPQAPATLSIGIASLRGTRAPSAEALIHDADVALYAAKEAGRNRAVDASELASTRS